MFIKYSVDVVFFKSINSSVEFSDKLFFVESLSASVD